MFTEIRTSSAFLLVYILYNTSVDAELRSLCDDLSTWSNLFALTSAELSFPRFGFKMTTLLSQQTAQLPQENVDDLERVLKGIDPVHTEKRKNVQCFAQQTCLEVKRNSTSSDVLDARLLAFRRLLALNFSGYLRKTIRDELLHASCRGLDYSRAAFSKGFYEFQNSAVGATAAGRWFMKWASPWIARLGLADNPFILVYKLH